MLSPTSDDPESLLLRALHLRDQARINALLTQVLALRAVATRYAVLELDGATICRNCHYTGTLEGQQHVARCVLVQELP